MSEPELHRTLVRQLRRLRLSFDEAPSLAAWQELLRRVDTTYSQADDDRYTLERALDLSSEEMGQLHEMLAERARTDDLTGLMNRSALIDDLVETLTVVPETPELALLFIDLDHFKEVNDCFGHSVGDEVLVQVASRLRSSVRQVDLVGRYGGDEFVAVLRGDVASDLADTIGQRIVDSIAQPFHVGLDHPVRIGASVGVARAEVGADVNELLTTADAAMYEAKLRGRGRLVSCNDPRHPRFGTLRSIG
jgi:diguanylate cyclase (GGDEF)-like protein